MDAMVTANNQQGADTEIPDAKDRGGKQCRNDRKHVTSACGVFGSDMRIGWYLHQVAHCSSSHFYWQRLFSCAPARTIFTHGFDRPGKLALGRADIAAAAAFTAFHTVMLLKGFHIIMLRIGGKQCGPKPGRQASTHLPTQLMQAEGSPPPHPSTYSSADAVFVVGTSRSKMQKPIMGPPDTIFSGSLEKPPASSISSR